MASYQVGKSMREEYRKYLEMSGVLDAETKVLVSLFEEPEKPSNPLDFLKQYLGGNGPESADVEALKLELVDLRQKEKALSQENAELKEKLAQYECTV